MFKGILKYDPTKEYYFEEGCYINELSNIEYDEAVSIVMARVPMGVKTRRHRLIDTFERYVILRGSGMVYVDNNPPEIVSKGDVVLFPPETVQSIENIGNDDLVFLAICSPRFVKKNYEDVDNKEG
ncbi:MAG TPA: cupin domain-containing protein [Nitrospirae bacterium]|nr:cupin domain-containing protein [Nitrospirota bacterium]